LLRCARRRRELGADSSCPRPRVRTESTAGNRAVVVALLAAAILPYLASIGFGYVLDDTTVIRSNAALNGWSSLWRVWTLPYGGLEDHYTGLYRPLTMTVFAFVWNAGQHWILWFHVLAILMNAFAALLVWRPLSRAIGRTPAILAALFFAAHPVHVEAVANVSNSSEVLVTIFTCLLALHLFRISAAATIGWRHGAAAGLLYLCAFLSKESGAVAAPLALLWVWGWRTSDDQITQPAGPFMSRWWRVLTAFVFVAAMVFVARAIVLGSSVAKESIAASGLEGSAIERGWRMLSLGPRIAALLMWPTTTNPHYGPTAFPEWTSLLASLTVLALISAVVLGFRSARRGDRRLLVAVLWTLIAFLPASNLLVATGQVLAERTLYLTSVGVAMLVGLLLDELEQYSVAVGPRRIWYLAFAVVIAVDTYFVGRAAIWTFVWRSNHSVFTQIVSADPRAYRGYWLLGLEARYRGRRDEGIDLLERAHSLYPRDRGLLLDLRGALLERGDSARARAIDSELAELQR